MKIPLSWLREFVDIPVEPRKLADDLTIAGLAVDALEPRGDDFVLDIDVTSNRVDCMNVYGVAREVSVLYARPLRPLELDFPETGTSAGEAVEVTIEAPDLCPRFCARVLEVRMGPSPAWVRDRLEAVGVRPISNMVDLSNYVMMEMGHPSHAFDLERLPGRQLRIRWARAGERVTTLDGVERELTPRIGVVAGSETPLALAGIMGGASSEVSDSTRLVALEAAYWEPLAIRRAAKALGMHTEASHRFERGADPEGTARSTARIAHLLARIDAGSVRPGLIDRVAVPRAPRQIAFRPARAAAVLGLPVTHEDSRRILHGLGFAIAPAANGAMEVEVPTWRGDVAREADLVEEVGRHLGLERIPFTMPPARRPEGLRPAQARERQVREVLVGAGVTEAINWAFVPARGVVAAQVTVANPIAEDQDGLRASVVAPGLLRTLQHNVRQGRRDLRVFELGRVFLPGTPLPEERRRLGIALLGGARAVHWSEPRRPTDFYDMKGLLEALAARLGVGLDLGANGGERPAFLHPGKSALVRLNGAIVGAYGALHPDTIAAWELREDAVVAELELDALLTVNVVPVRVESLPRSPAVTRDLSILLDASVTAAAIEVLVRSASGPLLREMAFRDRYDRPPVPTGKVSLTVSLRFQDPARTLTGAEVEGAVERVVAALRASGAEIRGA